MDLSCNELKDSLVAGGRQMQPVLQELCRPALLLGHLSPQVHIGQLQPPGQLDPSSGILAGHCICPLGELCVAAHPICLRQEGKTFGRMARSR